MLTSAFKIKVMHTLVTTIFLQSYEKQKVNLQITSKKKQQQFQLFVN